HPVIMRAVREALEAGVVLGGPNRWEGELARLVCERFPSVELVRFTNSGTEANMMNMVTARAHTGRTHVMAFNGGYHGGVFYFPPGGSPINAPFPFVMADYNDAEGTRALIGRHAGDLAAIVVEPMMGGGGGIPADREFLQMLRDEATRHGIVLIFDEVMTSRTAPGGIQGKLGIRPDLTSFGKYIGGGMSFGAFGGRRELMERYDPRRPDAWRHAGTFNNNVLTMSAGVAGLREVYTPEEAERLTARGDRLREELNELGRRYGVPVQATGVGSIMSVHFQERPVRTPADTAATPEAVRALLHLELLARGYYIARRGFIALNVMLEDEHYAGFEAAFGEFLEANRSVLAG
ncbi:MAG TPA: aminotransferase class III-fold pyridoxal phosphate-dependent enzyme, partial [Geminicoccaceae bacterium]|nr:aminotransferase class III-fold pyridoxal phosphate-dependent enzyme [Geminicoccaceae bacterium]